MIKHINPRIRAIIATRYICLGMEAILCIALLTCPVHGQVQGDSRLLQQVALTERANQQAIQTWQSEANVESLLVGAIRGEHWNISDTYKVDYDFDRSTNRSRFLWTQLSETGKKGSKQVDDKTIMREGAIRTEDAVYRLDAWSPPPPGREVRKYLRIVASSDRHRGEMSSDFDPFVFFTISSGLDVHDRLIFYFEHRDAHKSRIGEISVTRSGNRVTLKESAPIVQTTTTFDLDQGGNAVFQHSNDDEVETYRDRTFEQVSGVWVPKSVSFRHLNKKTGVRSEQKVTWTHQRVNQELPEGIFALESLGIHKGDRIIDTRTGVEYFYDSTQSPLPERRKAQAKTLVVTAVAGCLALLLLFGILRGIKQIWRRHAVPA